MHAVQKHYAKNMAMEKVQNKAEWNKRVFENAPRSGAFLQSYDWGAFQEANGREVLRYAFKNGLAQLIRMPLPTGKHYLYCPRGPLGFSADHLRVLGKSEEALFVRYEPVAKGEGKKIANIQPADTLITDLAQDEDVLLAKMHHKTRYNIRLAEKKGVEVNIASTDFDEAWTLFEVTGKRGGFGLHSKEYYQKMLEVLREDDCQAFLATASFKGEVLAATIMIDCHGTRTYLHGASSNEKRELMAPHLLHWKLLQDAKAKGLNAYDWWGIAPEGAENHLWAGVTRFKKGFGGDMVSYPGAFELPIDKFWYALYSLAKKASLR